MAFFNLDEAAAAGILAGFNDKPKPVDDKSSGIESTAGSLLESSSPIAAKPSKVLTETDETIKLLRKELAEKDKKLLRARQTITYLHTQNTNEKKVHQQIINEKDARIKAVEDQISKLNYQLSSQKRELNSQIVALTEQAKVSDKDRAALEKAMGAVKAVLATAARTSEAEITGLKAEIQELVRQDQESQAKIVYLSSTIAEKTQEFDRRCEELQLEAARLVREKHELHDEVQPLSQQNPMVLMGWQDDSLPEGPLSGDPLDLDDFFETQVSQIKELQERLSQATQGMAALQRECDVKNEQIKTLQQSLEEERQGYLSQVRMLEGRVVSLTEQLAYRCQVHQQGQEAVMTVSAVLSESRKRGRGNDVPGPDAGMAV